MKQWIIAALLLGTLSAFAQYTNRSSVLDGSGARSTGGVYTHISAAGQPGGIRESAVGELVHQAGFLQTFSMRPELDTDGDGLADEADRDNDGDALMDVDELSGASFDPATATEVNLTDTDSDGASDGQESVAGTDPLNIDAVFEIVTATNSAANRTIVWTARSNRTYSILYANPPALPLTNLLAVVTNRDPASGPWYVTTGTVADAGATTNRVYAVATGP